MIFDLEPSRLCYDGNESVSEGRFDLSTFRSERTNEASTLTITPKRSSSRDVGTKVHIDITPPHTPCQCFGE
ncbi:hypothetical protein TNCV_1753181 [Trichonephila clavipes]|nr:hypothetical protein TNCV_1753181 [Trichonephila clavipes]